MSSGILNAFTNFLAISEVLQDEDLYEVRTENDAQGNVLYVGRSTMPNADEAEGIWYIKKLSYDGNGFLNRVQLPVDGPNFTYIWDDRATYFS